MTQNDNPADTAATNPATTSADAPENPVVLTEVVDNVLVITLNRPEAKNAVNKDVAQGVAAAIDRFNEDDELAVAVLTGAGGTFCSGMDLKAFVRGESPSVEGRGFAGLTEAPPAKPLIAAVEGYALAGGFETMLACDLVVAADNAKFGLPEVKRGLVAAAGGVYTLPERTHRAIAMEMALTGDLYPTEFVAGHGLINRIVPAGQALEGALELARTIAANGPLAVRTSKQIIVESADWASDEKAAKQEPLTRDVFNSHDAIEGSKAFAEKRAPRWTGK